MTASFKISSNSIGAARDKLAARMLSVLEAAAGAAAPHADAPPGGPPRTDAPPGDAA